MRMMLHIFRKDVRRLWLEIAVTLALLAAFAWVELRTTAIWNRATRPLNSIAQTLKLLLVLSWWYLIASAIHQEAIAGHRQDWLTRPIEWKELLGAKLLFIFAFVNLPVFLSDGFILAACGFNPADYLPGLLMKQVFFSAFLLSIALMLAAVTNSLAQMALWTLGAAACMILPEAVLSQGHDTGWGALEWIRISLCSIILLSGVTAVLLLQYGRRGTAISRALVVLAGVLFALASFVVPWNAAFALQSYLSRQRIEPTMVRVSFEPDAAKPSGRTGPAGPESIVVGFSIHIADVPAGMDVACDRLDATIDEAGSVSRHSGWVSRFSADGRDGRFGAGLFVDRALYERVKHRPIRLRSSLRLTLLGKRKTARIPAQTSWAGVPGVGFCGTDTRLGPETLLVTCRYVVSRPPNCQIRLVDRETGAGSAGILRTESYSPFPVSVGISPIGTYLVAQFGSAVRSSDQTRVDLSRLPKMDIVFESEEPLVHIRRDFEVSNLRLAELVDER